LIVQNETENVIMICYTEYHANIMCYRLCTTAMI